MWSWDHTMRDGQRREGYTWLQHSVVTMTESSRQPQPESASSDPRRQGVHSGLQDTGQTDPQNFPFSARD